ncbi:hypothetical protein GH714_041759 [Hevea brasiliensis]|uniref:Leucine-rich repeat-containing N-terminal plant-type domain-containing protein n=1 Tax=Hevea brasiliensis TaxID=3981 RepID=A0A6A6MVK8_HEVBR|nr:hypothetical protein GH714_041759 [Hevea brasiliensis]
MEALMLAALKVREKLFYSSSLALKILLTGFLLGIVMWIAVNGLESSVIISPTCSELHLRTLSEEEYYAFNASGDYDEYWERSTFRGKISQSLLNLKHLKCLDLSNNNFEGIHIPKFLGSMKSLRYLNFSGAGFGGMIPHQLGNLSNLQYLNLEGDGYYEIYVENLDWLSSLSSLEFLDLSSVNLSKALDWLDAMNKLPSLVELHLSYCSLSHKLDFSHSNFDFS